MSATPRFHALEPELGDNPGSLTDDSLMLGSRLPRSSSLPRPVPLEVVVVHPVGFYRSVIIDTLTRDQGIVVRDQFGQYNCLKSCSALARSHLVIMGFDDTAGTIDEVESAMRLCHPLPVVLCANVGNARTAIRVAKLGARACVVNPISGEEILVAVRAAADMHGRQILVLPPGFVDGFDGEPVHRLTERETEILCLVGHGMSNRQISRSLAMSEGTVKRHLHHVYRKLNVGSRTEAVRRALQQGILGILDLAADSDCLDDAGG